MSGVLTLEFLEVGIRSAVSEWRSMGLRADGVMMKAVRVSLSVIHGPLSEDWLTVGMIQIGHGLFQHWQESREGND